MQNRTRHSITIGLLCLAFTYGVAQAQGSPPPGGEPLGMAGGMGGGELGGRAQLPKSPPGYLPNRGGRAEKVVPLNDVVAMVQERFNATAVKTDSLLQSGVLVYRIRLLSADRSKVWTVNVDAITGQIN
jgi:hypothetical protein